MASGRVELCEPTLADLDYICLNLRDADKREIYSVLPHDNPFLLARHTLAISCSPGGFVTVAHVGRPVAALGFIEHHPGVFDVMAFATNEWPLVVKALTRFVRQELTPALVKAGAHRAQCDSHMDHTNAHRWLKALGFRAECILHRYGKDKSDFIRFTLLREWVDVHINEAEDSEAQAAPAPAR